jgi:hypothetical protein
MERFWRLFSALFVRQLMESAWGPGDLVPRGFKNEAPGTSHH